MNSSVSVTRPLTLWCGACALSLAASAIAAPELSLSRQQPTLSGNAQSAEGVKPHYASRDGKAVYIVQLADAALASYSGGVGGLAATSPRATGAARLDANSPASRAYRRHLQGEQDRLIEHCEQAFGRSIAVPFTYQHAYNGVAMELSEEEARAIATMPDVVSVEREKFQVPMTDDGPRLIGAPAIWKGSNHPWRPGSMGEGAVVAILDSGINFDHPSFADVGGDGYDHDNPLGSGNYVPGSYCDVVDPAFCNDKLIGAWSFVQGPADPGSPDDSDNHGSHTASTAAGNVILAATVEAPTTSLTRQISGVAPHANIIAYDVCIETCPGSALLAALDQVVIDAGNLPDGIHALNYSISGGNDPYNDAIEFGFLNAVAAGIYVSTSAGNAGPGPATTGHNSPWVAATAASTHRRALRASVNDLTSDGAGLDDLPGTAFAAGYGPAPIVHAGDFPTSNGSSNDTDPAQCLDPFPAGHFNGEIVVCDRGTIARVAKGANVLAGGAGGYVLANLDAQGEDIVADQHFLPAVHIGATAGNELRAWLAAQTNTMATLSGYSLDISEANANIIAGFSSRGPNSSIDVVKPDITAPGVDIIAAYSSSSGSPAPEFGFLSGTSMASPHNAGSAALISTLTDWSPPEIKSALMMTARKPEDMLKTDGVTPADIFDAGAGRINLRRVLDAGLVLDESPLDFFFANPALGGDPSALNLASMADSSCVENCGWTRTVTNKSKHLGGWRVSVQDVNGVDFHVSPKWIFLRPGESADISVKADTTLGVLGYAFTELELEPFTRFRPKLHMPIAVQTQTSTSPLLLNKTVDASTARRRDILNYEINVTNGPITDVIEIVDELPNGVKYIPGSATSILVNGADVTPLMVSNNTISWSGTLDPGGIDVAGGAMSPAGYLPLSIFGIPPITPPANADDGGLIFNVPAFDYNGNTYTDVIVSVNGTLEAGTASGSATPGAVDRLPSPGLPNNLLAPLWADLDLTNGGNMYVGILGDGVNDFLIFEWAEVPTFADPTAAYSFQIWIQLGSDNIWFTYGDLTSTDISMTVGAENDDGTNGDSYYHNSASTTEGTPPVPGDELEVVVLDGGSLTVNFQAQLAQCRGNDRKKINRAQLTAGDRAETAIAVTVCENKRRRDDDDDDDDGDHDD